MKETGQIDDDCNFVQTILQKSMGKSVFIHVSLKHFKGRCSSDIFLLKINFTYILHLSFCQKPCI